MDKTRRLTGIWMLLAAALLAAAPAFADEFARTAEPFVQGAQINHPGYKARYTGRETMANFQNTGDESGQRTALYDQPVKSVSAFAPQQLTLQRPWSDGTEALGVGN